jgi:CRP-like cAMP-binding protein
VHLIQDNLNNLTKALLQGVSLSIRLDREAIKVRILSLLKDRPLRNADIRNFTDLGRQQVYRIMKELESDDLVYQEGHGQAALWHLKQSLSKQ